MYWHRIRKDLLCLVLLQWLKPQGQALELLSFWVELAETCTGIELLLPKIQMAAYWVLGPCIPSPTWNLQCSSFWIWYGFLVRTLIRTTKKVLHWRV